LALLGQHCFDLKTEKVQLLMEIDRLKQQQQLRCHNPSFTHDGSSFLCHLPVIDLYLLGMYQIFASVPNSGPNSVFIFGRIVSSERIRIVSLYSAARDVYGRLHSVSARFSCSDRCFWEMN